MRSIIVVTLALVASPSLADGFDARAGKGLANVLALTERCGYSISTDRLATYMEASGLNTPEALGWIKHKQAQEEGWAKDATDADCAMARSTGQKIGIIE